MSPSAHDDTVRDSFRRQVDKFSGPDSPFAQRPPGSLSWVEPLDADLVVLEVACGAAHVAEEVAGHVRAVVGIDLTPELLALGAERLRDAGVRNVVLQEANGEALPFVHGTFDLVCCRGSLHHFGVPEAAVVEMVRVCRPGGRVVISDLVAPAPKVRDRFDHLHQLLDPSHRRAFVEAELPGLFPAATDLTYAETTTSRYPLDIAVTQQSDGDAVIAALRDELAGGAETGFAPSEDDGALVVAFVSCTVEVTVRTG